MIPVYGAILGDIVGSPYEFDCNNCKTKDFPLFSRRSQFTDDTVMTLAVAKALLDTHRQEDAAIKAALVREMQRLGRLYPDRGYGARPQGCPSRASVQQALISVQNSSKTPKPCGFRGFSFSDCLACFGMV